MTTTTTRRREPRVERRETVTVHEEVHQPTVSVRTVERKPETIREETIVTEIIEEIPTEREERIVVPSVEIQKERRNVTIGVSQAEREALLIETEAR